MKSAYLFASILAPTCFFAHPLDHDEDKSSNPRFAREILEERSPQTADGNAISPFNDFGNDNATTPQPDPPSNSNNTGTSETGQLVGDGDKTGIQITTYTNANCKGLYVSNILTYDIPIVNQFQSYSLDSDLGFEDEMGAFADINWSLDVLKPVDLSLNGNQNLACAQYAYNLTGALGTQGCHTLNTTVGCIYIGVNQPAGSLAP